MTSKKQNRFLHAITPDSVKLKIGTSGVDAELDYLDLKDRGPFFYIDPKTGKKLPTKKF